MITVYLKAEQSCCLNKAEITLNDIAKIYCTDKDIEYAVKKIQVMKFEKNKNGKSAVSILKLVALIQNHFKDVSIVNMGPTDLLVYYKPGKDESKLWVNIKIALVCAVAFFGSAFSIMTYNNDVGAQDVFNLVQQLFTGQAVNGPSVMQLSYSIGLTIGVIVFFNHAANKKLSDDPTPFEVQMRLYERDVNDTFIIGSGRKEETIDVD